jgi:hypothetical protein
MVGIISFFFYNMGLNLMGNIVTFKNNNFEVRQVFLVEDNNCTLYKTTK